jgi:hypothetical protein
MNLSFNFWYVRYFFFCENVINKFCLGYWKSEKDRQDDLNWRPMKLDICKFMRTIFLGSFLYVINISVVFWFLFTFLVLPAFTGVGYEMHLILLYAIILIIAILSVLVGFAFLFDCISKYKNSKNHEKEENTGAATVFTNYVKSVKNKYCTLITIVAKESKDV